MPRDTIKRLIVGKIERAFDEARDQAASRIAPPPEDPEQAAKRRLRQALDARVSEWDRTIETAIRNGKERLLIMRCGGKIWYERSERFKRGSWRHSSQGTKFDPLLEGLELDWKLHGLRRLRTDRLSMLVEWIEETYWHGVWLEHYARSDQGMSWKPGEISSVQEICEELMLTWL